MSDNKVEFQVTFDDEKSAEAVLSNLMTAKEYLSELGDAEIPADEKGRPIMKMGFEGGSFIEKLNQDKSSIEGEMLIAPSMGICEHFADFLNENGARKIGVSLYFGQTGEKIISEYENGEHIRTINEEELYDSRLHKALMYKRPEWFKELVEDGADVNAIWHEHMTPLHMAADTGCLEAVKILIEKGADVNSKTVNGTIPLHKAASHGDIEIAKTLIECGSEIDAEENCAYGGTPLHRAAYEGFRQIAELLSDNGADINYANKYGAPITLGCRELSSSNIKGRNHKETIEFLIRRGADLDIVDSNGNTALLNAIYRPNSPNEDSVEIAEMLIEQGADIQIGGWLGETALHLATESGLFSIVKLLVEKGADLNKTDDAGRTALDSAFSRKKEKIADFLRQNGAKRGEELNA